MPDEPYKTIEDQLKTWAKQRRAEAGAPFELHPATRKLLQDEVARTCPPPADKPRSHLSRLALLWPRLAWGAPALIVCVIAAALLWPTLSPSKSKGSHLALRKEAPAKEDDVQTNQPALDRFDQTEQLGDEARVAMGPRPAAETEPKSAMAPADGSSRALSLDSAQATARSNERDLAVRESAENRTLAEQASVPSRAAPAEATTVMRQRYGLDATKSRAGTVTAADARSKSPAAAPTSAQPAPAVRLTAPDSQGRSQPGTDEAISTRSRAAKPEAARTGETAGATTFSLASRATGKDASRGTEENRGATFFAAESAGQHFTQMATYRRNFNSPAGPEVLHSFRLVQNGERVRIVDQDNSIYEGEIIPPIVPALSSTALKISNAPSSAPDLIDQPARRDTQTGAGLARIQNLKFRVAGTNRSLNQLVLFEGNLQTDTNRSALAAGSVGQQVTLAPSAPAAGSAAGTLQNTVINGRAIFGNNSIEINAIAVAP